MTATTLLLGFSIIGGSGSSAFAAAEQQTPEQIMRAIGDKYSVGEILSDEDAELVKNMLCKLDQN
ncbi:hypothetical protein P4V60_19540 [Brevibacillus porteri]|uniref:Uncharacterized protein n=1 Tax=Brevibacillus porteri TaxID=2126350 RepID=A0ABX5FJI7_9BACL|nr:hypothetical protein [Brevibacillus porteri]MED1800763.1 hypothetical protein [Brevibacillus porteri]MED2132637.1 hypothetical protein [Brevibacillus porteri]PSK06358.1 hypothetical protein C7R92_23255 [Brevibacillus porteri]